MNAIKDAGYVQPVKAPEQSMIAYQVGKTEDGKVTLQMGGPYGSTTCTMDNAGVRQLIRMLESAMEEVNEQ